MNIKKLILIILSSIIIFSCYTDFSENRRLPKPASIDAKKLEADYKSNDYRENQEKISQTKRQPWEFWPLFLYLEGGKLLNRSIIEGDEYTKRMRYPEALESYLDSRGYSKDENYRETLVLRLASTELSLGKPKAALAALSSFTRRVGKEANEVSAHLSLMFAFAYSRLREFEQGLAWFSRAHNLATPSDRVFVATDRGLKLLIETLSDDIFNQIRSNWRGDQYINSFIGREANRRLSGGKPIQKNGFWHIYKPSTYLSSDAGNNELAKIAVLLPFKGKFAPLGSAVKNGFELALDGLNLRSRISLSYYNTNGDAVIASAIARSIVNATSEEINDSYSDENVLPKSSFSKADFIIGPLLSDTSLETAQIFSDAKIPQLVFSKHSDFITSATTYRLGATINSQMESLINAIEKKSLLESLAVVYPDDSFSLSYANAFKEMVYKKGGRIVYEAAYDPDNANSFIVISKELKSLKNRPRAIFFPDSLHMASKLLISFPENIKLTTSLLGTVRWDNDTQLTRSKTLFKGIIFPNPFFEQSKNKFISQFVKTYSKTYKQEPGFLAAQGFDAGTMVLNAVLDSYRNKISMIDAFSNIEAYSGLTGEIEVSYTGELKRSFKVVELTSRGLKELKY